MERRFKKIRFPPEPDTWGYFRNRADWKRKNDNFVFDTQLYSIGYYAIMACYMGVTRGYGPNSIDPGMVFADSSNLDEVIKLIEQGYF